MARAPFIAVVLLLCVIATTPPAAATTYVPVSDQALVERAAVIGTFEVLSSDLAPTARLTTEYRMRVDALLKGDLREPTALVRIPGGEARGEGLRFSGLPSFRPGERVLLFLVPRTDGAWGVAHVLLGAFHEIERPEGDLLVRPHLLEARSVDRSGVSVAGDGATARDRQAFLDWIADRAAGRAHAADYLVPVDAAALAPRFTVFRDPDSQIQLRWFDFDQGGAVLWHAASSGLAGYVDGGVAAVRAGLTAWNSLTQATINLQYGGKTPVDLGFDDSDGVNTVLFEDPHHEIEEAFDCSQGGVLAIGGPFYITQDSGYKNETWYPIVEGVVITNSNLSCFLRGNTNRLAEVLGHELGHTLGLGHSCGGSRAGVPDCATSAVLDDALMRATVHNDNRGARLGEDDMAAGRALYGQEGDPPPRAPIKLTAQVVSDDAKLQWNDRSNNETGFYVYRRAGNAAFAVVGQTAAGLSTFLDANLPVGTYDYEVRAWNAAGESATSNRVRVDVGTQDPGTAKFRDTVFYGFEQSATASVLLDRIAGKTGPLSVRLRTSDLSAAAPFDYAAKTVVVTWANLDDQPKFVDVTIVNDFAVEGTELLEVLLETVPASGQPATTLGKAVVAIADDDGSPGCATADSTLCLLGGRFKVEVEWRNQRTGERGSGHALPGSDQSGYFWFFASDNVELIVKAIDGRLNNGNHWLFYGALSDVEYWVTVTDTATGERKLYHNPPGGFCGVGDTRAFPPAELAGAAMAPIESREVGAASTSWLLPATSPLTRRAACVADATTLCLLGGRFQVEVEWRNHRTGATGVGTAIPFSDQTGLFWFFDHKNIELVTKSLDGQGINGKFWFFYGALSDIEYTIRVTDTATGAEHSYNNAGGNICGAGDTSAFPGDGN